MVEWSNYTLVSINSLNAISKNLHIQLTKSFVVFYYNHEHKTSQLKLKMLFCIVFSITEKIK